MHHIDDSHIEIIAGTLVLSTKVYPNLYYNQISNDFNLGIRDVTSYKPTKRKLVYRFIQWLDKKYLRFL